MDRVHTDWIEHRRGTDGERLGWMIPDGDGFIAVDLLGRRHADAVDWLTAEETLDELGIAYLADPYELRLESGSWVRVRIAEITPREVRVKKDDWGDMTAPQLYFSVRLPIDERVLRPLPAPR